MPVPWDFAAVLDGVQRSSVLGDSELVGQHVTLEIVEVEHSHVSFKSMRSVA